MTKSACLAEALAEAGVGQDSFFTLRRDNPDLAKWVKERHELHKNIIRQRVQEHAGIFDTTVSTRVTNEREVFEKFIRPKFLEMLTDSGRKRKLLEGVLGLTFRTRHPD